MSDRFTVEKVKKSPMDITLIALIALLLGVGLTMLFNASYYFGNKEFDDSFYLVKRQLFHVLLGALVALILANTPLALLKKLIPGLLIVSLVLSLLTFTGMGARVKGARRWIYPFGYSFQPSVLVKFALILYLAHIFSKKEEKINDLVYTILPPFLIASLLIVIVYLQDDFSSAFFLFFITVFMFFIARVRLLYFAGFFSAIIPLGLIMALSKEHVFIRLLNWWNPNVDPQGAGFQLRAAKEALMSGGFWGRGIGNGVKKFGGLPEVHSDFIFAVVAEEMGFLGVLFVLGLFIAFAVRGYQIALKTESRFGYYLAMGITTAILYQVLLNVFVVSGLLPATGLTLPFFSHGGSSILIVLSMCGILLKLSRNLSIKKTSSNE